MSGVKLLLLPLLVRYANRYWCYSVLGEHSNCCWAYRGCCWLYTVALSKHTVYIAVVDGCLYKLLLDVLYRCYFVSCTYSVDLMYSIRCTDVVICVECQVH